MPDQPSDRFQRGDRVRITGGTFNGFEGILSDLDETATGRVTVMIVVFGRTVPVAVEIRQIEPIN